MALPYYPLTRAGVNDPTLVNADLAYLDVRLSSLPVTKSATNLGAGWYRIATAPAGNNVGLFRVVHRGQTKTSTIVFTLTQAQGSTEPNVNILAADISDR